MGVFLEDVTKADVLIGPKLSDFGDKYPLSYWLK